MQSNMCSSSSHVVLELHMKAMPGSDGRADELTKVTVAMVSRRGRAAVLKIGEKCSTERSWRTLSAACRDTRDEHVYRGLFSCISYFYSASNWNRRIPGTVGEEFQEINRVPASRNWNWNRQRDAINSSLILSTVCLWLLARSASIWATCAVNSSRNSLNSVAHR